MADRYPFQSLKLSIAALCEYAIESRGRWTLVGTFRHLEFASFPATLERLEVYLLFTDVTGRAFETAGISLWPSVDEAAFEQQPSVVEGFTEVTRPTFPDAYEAVLRFRDVVIPGPGRYDLYVETDGDVYDLISVFVRSSG